eukprot:gene10072-7011_t
MRSGVLPSLRGAAVLRAGCVAAAAAAAAAPAADIVGRLPDFPAAPFKVYSGYINVSGPVNGYDSLSIHYEFHESQRFPGADPVVAWHQGGPGGSSLYGAFGELGYFQTNATTAYVNPYAWNRVANMLYLESPAGCDDPVGFSFCTTGGRPAMAAFFPLLLLSAATGDVRRRN